MRTDAELFTIDTNIILRYLTRDAPDLYAKSVRIMRRLAAREIRVFCDPVTLSEVVWALTKYYGKTPADIWEALEPIVKDEGFLIPNKDRYIRALELHASSVPHFGDACACAAALETRDGRLLSFDRSVSGVPGVQRLESAGED